MKKFRVVRVGKKEPYLYQPQVKRLWWRSFIITYDDVIIYFNSPFGSRAKCEKLIEKYALIQGITDYVIVHTNKKILTKIDL